MKTNKQNRVKVNEMLNKTNIVAGVMLILGGLGEIVSTQAICPLCIGAITGGGTVIANEFGIKLNK
ncbi:MAG: hypothetical protein Q7S22_08545 [Candidatus Micrarchaeota archaeon]|nr:hypothetical protein [Candidatus Micrarchaeota archaeon]